VEYTTPLGAFPDPVLCGADLDYFLSYILFVLCFLSGAASRVVRTVHTLARRSWLPWEA
jgi:hypothetical protein